MKYILDTHALIWFLEGNPSLGTNAQAILSQPMSELILPAIALAEAIWIVSRKKTSIPSAQVLLDVINRDPRITVYPLDQGILEIAFTLLAIREMHDQQIVATALAIQNKGEAVTLLTCDQNIVAANLIAIIW